MNYLIFLCIIAGFIAVMRLVFFKGISDQPQPEAADEQTLLQQHVLFYQRLNEEEKAEFAKRVHGFLDRVRITGVGTTVEDIDKVFIAAGAIIPIFAFKDWQYRNIHEVLLYPNSFDAKFKTEGKGRNVLGMVGEGGMQDTMILSQPELRSGFLNTTDKNNTAIHEFVHLVDKDDGYTDGCPNSLLPHRYALPWLKRIHDEIQLIENGRSDINPYGTTNEAEFLAVASEYFFEQPELMERKHPELFAYLQQIFIPAEAGDKIVTKV
jgi:hypothetical protein